MALPVLIVLFRNRTFFKGSYSTVNLKKARYLIHIAHICFKSSGLSVERIDTNTPEQNACYLTGSGGP